MEDQRLVSRCQQLVVIWSEPPVLGQECASKWQTMPWLIFLLSFSTWQEAEQAYGFSGSQEWILVGRDFLCVGRGLVVVCAETCIFCETHAIQCPSSGLTVSPRSLTGECCHCRWHLMLCWVSPKSHVRGIVSSPETPLGRGGTLKGWGLFKLYLWEKL